MTELLFIFWAINSILIVFTNRVYRIVIYFGIFSLITSVLHMFLGAPDVAIAEAAISAFATVFLIVCVERYYAHVRDLTREETVTIVKGPIIQIVLPLMFAAVLLVLFFMHVPGVPVSSYLKDQYLTMFMYDVGGENAVTSIYLAYRVYDTLFEALILVVAVVAVSHMSWTEKTAVPDGRHSEIESSSAAKFTMRIICPIILLFGAYLMMNGHFSPGGGFQGGLAVASFFICRYLVHDIYDMPIKKVMRIEEMVFITIAMLPIFTIFTAFVYLTVGVTPLFQNIYIIMMNVLIGLKVACGFFILFYRYVAIERLHENDIAGG